MTEISEVEPNYTTGLQIDLTISNGELEGTYSTVVQEVDSNNLIVEIPRMNDLYLPLDSGSGVLLKHYEEGATFEAETRVINRRDDVDPPALFIEIPETVQRIQRRDFVRVPCEISADVNVLNPGDDDGPKSDDLNGTIEDISAGGVQLTVDEWLPLYTDIELVFTLPKVKNTLNEVFGKIIRVPDDQETPASFGVKFTSITEVQRNDIIQYVYEKQMEQKQ